MKPPKRILICPLDWGLGHATRCIPIIRELRLRNCEVIIASSGSALTLLEQEFPLLQSLTITAYNPTYSRTSAFLTKMLVQLPGFFLTIRKEHQEIQSIVNEHQIDIIISDNRYGCYSNKATSIFITHQTNIQAPKFFSRNSLSAVSPVTLDSPVSPTSPVSLGSPVCVPTDRNPQSKRNPFSKLINFFNHRQIKKFDKCWVPDLPGESSLAGDLSLAGNLNVTYIGHLSRFKSIQLPIQYDLVAIISGPEPQRSIFENLIKAEFNTSGKRTMIIKGLPGKTTPVLTSDTTEVDHLPALAMNEIIAKAEIIVSRPGYTTLMDLAVMEKKAIFIPTPGQTEQEYLGANLMEKGIALCVAQDSFDVNDAINRSKSYTGFKHPSNDDLLGKALNSLLIWDY